MGGREPSVLSADRRAKGEIGEGMTLGPQKTHVQRICRVQAAITIVRPRQAASARAIHVALRLVSMHPTEGFRAAQCASDVKWAKRLRTGQVLAISL